MKYYEIKIQFHDEHEITRDEIKQRILADISLDFDVDDMELMEIDDPKEDPNESDRSAKDYADTKAEEE